MKLLKAIAYIILLIILAVAAAPHITELRNDKIKSAQLSVSSPEIMIDQIIGGVFNAVRLSKAKRKKIDPAELRRIAETQIAPYCDFEQMTRLAVGRPWQTASPSERAELTSEFRTLLLRLYSTVLSDYSDYNYRIMSRPPGPTATDATIKVELQKAISEGNSAINISVNFEKGADGRWRIVDVSLDGISVLMSYRSGFQNEIKNNGIQGLINNIRDMNSGKRKN